MPLDSISNRSPLAEPEWGERGAAELAALQDDMRRHGHVLTLQQVSPGAAYMTKAGSQQQAGQQQGSQPSQPKLALAGAG